MHRREFLAGTGAGALALSLPGVAAAQARTPASVRLAEVMDAIFTGDMRLLPDKMTTLGLDSGDGAWASHYLYGRGRGAIDERLDHARRMRTAIRAVPTEGLTEREDLHRAVVADMLDKRLWGESHGIENVGYPYVISQRSGVYFSVPNFLDTKHKVETKENAEAYLHRLSEMARGIDEESDLQREQSARGMVAPAWSLDMALDGIGRLMAPAAEQTTLVRSLADRAAAAGIDGAWEAQASAIVDQQIRPAFARQITMLKDLKQSSAAGDGIWRVPDADALYARQLAYFTTTDLSADEIHRIGLAQVAEISAELETMLSGQGLTQGTVGERLTAFNARPDQLYADSDAGRAALIEFLNDKTQAMWAKLPQAFATLPTHPVEVRAVPVEIQDGASLGYYNSSALDGSRPGIFWVNLRHVEDWPGYTLPALAYHEAVPGHHLHGSLMQEAGDLPMIMKDYFISAHGEGWALYAEQVAEELGGYAGIEKAGALQSWLFRAARLVIDTGLHAKRWSIEEATRYYVDTVGFTETRSRAEVLRYCVQPGQACSYKIGQNKWRELRQRAETALGDDFDLREFHRLIEQGTMPLTLLEKQVDRWIAGQLA